MKRALYLALCLISVATAADAQASDPGVAGGTADISGNGADVPGGASRDVYDASSGATPIGPSGRGDRRTLDDLKAGTSGSTQIR